MIKFERGERYKLIFHGSEVYIQRITSNSWLGSWPIHNMRRQLEINELSFIVEDQIYFFQQTDAPDVFVYLRSYSLENNAVTATATVRQLNPMTELRIGERYTVKVATDRAIVAINTETYNFERYYKSLSNLRIRINGVDCEFRQIFENSNMYELTQMIRYSTELVIGRRYEYDVINLLNIWFQNSLFLDDRLRGYVKEITKEKVKMRICSDMETIYTFKIIDNYTLELEEITYASR